MGTRTDSLRTVSALLFPARVHGGASDGKENGLSPLETLAAIYVGLQLFGLFGFLLGPIGLLIIKDFVEEYGDEDEGTVVYR